MIFTVKTTANGLKYKLIKLIDVVYTVRTPVTY
jgi:hypothetical protein